MTNKKERLNDWASQLNQEQTKKLLIETVECLIDINEVRFPNDSKAPYWEGDGEPLIEGQVTFED